MKNGAKKGSEVAEYFFKRLPKQNSGWTLDDNAELLVQLQEEIELPEYINTSEEFLKLLLEAFSRITESEFVGEKTPPHIYFVDEINKTIEDSKFITIHRDPRAIALSELNKLVKKGPDRKFNILKVLYRWYSSFYYADKYQARNDLQTTVVRYEELLSNPEETLKHLSQFVGLEMEEAMLDIQVINSSFNDTMNGFDTSKITKWKQELNAEQGYLLEKVLSEQMSELGYEKYFIDKNSISLFRRVFLSIKASMFRLFINLVGNNKSFINYYYGRKR